MVKPIIQNLDQIQILTKCQVEVLLIWISSVDDHHLITEVTIVVRLPKLVFEGLGIIKRQVNNKIVSRYIHVWEDVTMHLSI